MVQGDSRYILTETIKQALDGKADFALLREAIADPQALSPLEKSAWLQLQNWAADEYLRRHFPMHAEFSQRRLGDLLVRLER